MKLYHLSIESYHVKWKTIEDYPNYEVSNTGKIRTKLTRKERKFRSDKDGYQEVVLYKDGVRYYVKVHQIVAKTFLRAKKDKLEVNHKDKDRRNNDVSNLEFMNRQENMAHRYANLTSGEEYQE